jgi:predicted DsbA family dithiol-disulfide isomerase
LPVHVLYVTDPACPWSWGAEPAVRRLEAEFGEEVRITYVMGGLAREFERPVETMRHVLDASEATGMPVDPRLWLDAPPKSSYPACLAVKAAAEQGLDGPYLRRVREALMCERVKADNPDALTALARDVPGMNVERFVVDLASNAIVEAFGADLDVARSGPVPRVEVDGEAVAPKDVRRLAPRAAPLGVEDALRRFGKMATPEVAEVCDLPGPRAPAELWRLALEWKARRDSEMWMPA